MLSPFRPIDSISSLTARSLTRRRALRATAVAAVAAAVWRPVLALAAGAPVGEYPTLEIVARDFTFDVPAEIVGGWTAVTLHNEGPPPHHIMFMRLHDDADPADFLAAAAAGDEAALFQLADGVGGPGGVQPGAASTVVLNLEAGDYFLICAIPSPNEVPHYMDGMIVPMTVTAPAATLAAPVADQTLDLADFSFTHLPATIPAGPQVWEVVNLGSEPHELVVARLAPGADFETLKQSLGLSGPPPAGTPAAHEDHTTASPDAVPIEELLAVPIIAVAGVAPYSPGFTNFMVADLAAGDYALLCFVGSPAAGGAPHFVLGMIMPLTVA